MSRSGATPPAVAFTAHSGTGKTTLIEALIAEFVSRGLRVGALKHDAHRFNIDHPGKDSARFTAAGAEVMILASDAMVAEVRRTPVPASVHDLLRNQCAGMDLVLVEGFTTSGLPKIAVHRAASGKGLRGGDDPHLIAVASDEPVEVKVPVLPLDEPAKVADFIAERFL